MTEGQVFVHRRAHNQPILVDSKSWGSRRTDLLSQLREQRLTPRIGGLRLQQLYLGDRLQSFGHL